MRGIRRIIQDETEPGFCTRPAFVEGVRLLERFGWSFDICIFGHQMADAIQLVDLCPDVSFVLDHIGKPPIRDGRMEPWRRRMFALAERPNVMCKLSGVATEADHASWKPEDLRRYMDVALEAFGPNRLMFGSDWPVATEAIAARSWLDLVDEALSDLTLDEQRSVFAGTAERFYRL
ncbi:MAG: amidohydrolase family protein [Jannaschia sp.]